MRHRTAYLGSTIQSHYYIYILANADSTVLYTGVTSNLWRRMYQHKSGTGSAFTRRFRVNKLVYYEILPNPATAIAREKQLKAVSRQKRMDVVTGMNADWRDLYHDLNQKEITSMETTATKTTKPKQRAQPASDLPQNLGKPAQRALAGVGVTKLAQLAKRTEAEIKQLHGIGPNALDQLRQALTAKGLSFARDKKKK